jgi:hypothetical protein
MAQLNFDASQVAPSEALEAIPAGWYNAQMTASGMKPTSDGTGAYLQAEFTVLSGDYAGRKLFDRINLQNKNPVAVEIGYKTLSAICHAVGVIQVQDSQQLHGRPLQLKVSLRAAGPGADGKHYEASNEVKGYKAVDGAGVPMAGAPAGGAPSWAPQAPAQQAAPQYAPPPAAAPQQWAPPAQPAAAAPQQWQQPAPQAPQAPAPQQWAPPAQQAAPAPQQAAPTPPWQGQPAAQAPAVGQPVAQSNAPVPPWAQPAK